jgi:hypothetical protein
MRIRILSALLFSVVALFVSVPVAEACDANSDPGCTLEMGEGGGMAARRASSISTTDLWCEASLRTSFWASHWVTVTMYDPSDNVIATDHEEYYPRHITNVDVSAAVEPGTYPCTAEFGTEGMFVDDTVFYVVGASLAGGRDADARKPRLVRMNEVFPTLRDGWTSSWRAVLSHDPSWTRAMDAYGQDDGTAPARAFQRRHVAPSRKQPAVVPPRITWRRDLDL